MSSNILINDKHTSVLGIKEIKVGNEVVAETYPTDGIYLTRHTATATTVYNKPASNWLFIDLETGANGGWFPGSTAYAKLRVGQIINVWADETESSSIVVRLINKEEVKITDILDNRVLNWYAVEATINDKLYTGYVRLSDIREIIYRAE